LDGHSLRPLLQNPETNNWGGPPVALTCWMGKPTPEQRADCMIQGAVKDQHFTVCSKRYRYILANNGDEELYDHQNDPHEWTNRAADSALAPVKSELHVQLESLIKAPSKP
jgi:hypothetical protein